MTVNAERPTAADPVRKPPAWIWAALLGALVVSGALLRVAFALRSGLWRDEALTMYILNAPDFWGYVRHHDSHPPLYYLISFVWRACFGRGADAELALSVCFGVALIPTIA